MNRGLLKGHNMGWFLEMCEEMEELHGERGWKRRLAEMLGVSDSNVQNWIRVGDAPPIVKTAFEARQQVHDLEKELADRERDNFVIEELDGGRGFRILCLDAETGRFVEAATTCDLKLARALLQFVSGALDQKICALVDRVEPLIENYPDDQRALNDLLNWRLPTRRERVAEMKKTIEVVNDANELKGLQNDK